MSPWIVAMAWITGAVEGSLRRLQTDWIDLYQLGAPDPNTDIDETLGTLTDLVQAGKIRSFGASKVPVSQIVEAQWTSDRLPAARNGLAGLQPADRGLAVG